MPPPTPLSIAISSVLRLVKEESSYHQELLQQESRLEKLQSRSQEQDGGDDDDDDDGNKGWRVGQEKRAIEETKAVFPSLRARIKEAVGRLEAALEARQESGKEGNAEEITKAKEALAKAKESEREIA